MNAIMNRNYTNNIAGGLRALASRGIPAPDALLWLLSDTAPLEICGLPVYLSPLSVGSSCESTITVPLAAIPLYKDPNWKTMSYAQRIYLEGYEEVPAMERVIDAIEGDTNKKEDSL